MNFLKVGFAIATFITGSVAAWYWYKASQVEVDFGTEPESGDPMLTRMRWEGATMDAIKISSGLNKTAACWTMVTVVLGTITNLIGCLIQK